MIGWDLLAREVCVNMNSTMMQVGLTCGNGTTVGPSETFWVRCRAWRKVLRKFKQAAIIVLAIVGLLALSCQAELVNAQVVNFDFIVFSDTHIGRTANTASGTDGLASVQRYQLIINATNKLQAGFMVNCGDLTDGWWGNNTQQGLWYEEYMNITAMSTHNIYNIRGNHDANGSAYTECVGGMTYYERYGNVFMFDLGMNFYDTQSWLTTGVCYQQYQVDMLYQAVHSSTYNASQYHFLFMHFEPNSTWPIPAQFGVPTSIRQFLPYFSVVFCGHEGGPEKVFMYNSTLVVHCAHLGDGNTKTDTYLAVHIAGQTKIMTVTSNNFETGNQYTLWTGKTW
jgi:hypothetical protein